jgi:hypothetical protein
LKSFPNTRDRNGSISGPTAWQICDVNDDGLYIYQCSGGGLHPKHTRVAISYFPL